MKRAMSIESSCTLAAARAGRWPVRFELRRALAFAAAALAVAGSGNISLAQVPKLEPRTSDAAQAVATYRVGHDHAIGSGPGELVITNSGFEYRGTSEDEARHDH